MSGLNFSIELQSGGPISMKMKILVLLRNTFVCLPLLAPLPCCQLPFCWVPLLRWPQTRPTPCIPKFL
jgi:hypothetical protein